MIVYSPVITDYAQSDPLWMACQHTESWKHNRAFHVLVLDSGKIAVITHMWQTHALCDTWDEVGEAAKTLPKEFFRRPVGSGRPTKVKRHEEQVQDLSDLLGL